MIRVEEGHVQVEGNLSTVLAELHVLIYSLAKDENMSLMGLQNAILDAFAEVSKHV